MRKERGESMSAQPADATAKKDWSWLPAHMPGVSRLIAEKRRKHGAAWVQTCWRNGVTLGQPGHFWACEGPICVGTPPADWSTAPAAGAKTGEELWADYRAKFPTAHLLLMADPEAAA